MIETTTTTSTTDPKILCSAVHLSKICTKKDTNILLQKENQRKRCQCKFLKIYPSKIYLQVSLKQLQKD